MTRSFVLLLLGLCVAGCEETLGYGSSIPELRIFESTFRPGDTVRADLVNRSPRLVRPEGCGVALEQRTSEAWLTVVPEPQLCAAGLNLLGGGSIVSHKLPLPDSLTNGVYRLREMIIFRGQPPASPIFSPTFRVIGGD